MSDDIPLIEAVKTPAKDVVLDPAGFFVIEVRKGRIVAEYYENVYKEGRIVSGKLKMIFMGDRADAVSDTIAKHITGLRPEHYMYIGRELQRAEDKIRSKEIYEQDGC
ncbi:MAG: hypothetical protein QXS02_05015 [Candidatus Thermoplasmatota archaeon]